MALSDDVKKQVSLVDEAERVVTWDTRKSSPKRGDYWSPCPFHGEATPSFHVTEKPGTPGQFYCFGCFAKGSVIDFVMALDGVSFGEAVKRLADSGGVGRVVDPAQQKRVRDEAAARQAAAEAEAEAEAEQRHASALRLWKDCAPNHIGPVADYLIGRGIDLDALGGVPPTLRYHPNLPARSESGQIIYRGPAMVAAIGRGRLVGVHRTWIDGPTRARLPDGTKVPKASLGRTGSIYGQPVRLTPPAPGGDMIVGEGIETTLAGLVRFRRDMGDKVAAECALNLGAMTGPADPDAPAEGVSSATGKALPSPRPLFDTDRPGWLPAEPVHFCMILTDPSTKCPETARLNAERARAKISPRCTHAASLAIPLDRWDHGEDFADLAQKGLLK
ncbi:hypothetical protein KX928_17530 [Roseobacter sp. YSTF-M11]|uniref:Zinc finger CHC2-type domain-containing protein n=1 Tax=Roseobacter insulae TaxID=2859783 RepID=A0A9X1JZN8_9RHOB|nr:CHC2 zinc finger domain-containing protein [Roseobacter insulae]MBW4709591.1 hypothetical protein [Roseobacter insulae]